MLGEEDIDSHEFTGATQAQFEINGVHDELINYGS